MGSIRKLNSNPDIQAFPGAQFQIVGTVPAPQCSEAKIEGTNATTTFPPWKLNDPGKFAGYTLGGNFLTVTKSTGGFPGTFAIQYNDDDSLTIGEPLGIGTEVEYYIHNSGSLILTRDIASFATYIHNAGYAYTIKGRTLYTNMPNDLIKNACTILFDPID